MNVQKLKENEVSCKMANNWQGINKWCATGCCDTILLIVFCFFFYEISGLFCCLGMMFWGCTVARDMGAVLQTARLSNGTERVAKMPVVWTGIHMGEVVWSGRLGLLHAKREYMRYFAFYKSWYLKSKFCKNIECVHLYIFVTYCQWTPVTPTYTLWLSLFSSLAKYNR
jgi:hypothetical protein